MRKDEPLRVLQQVYGYKEFRGQQAAIINAVCAGQDTLVIMPTGGGKSVCYQIPALLLEGLAIVVSPLIALMRDQVEALNQVGVSAAYLNSTLTRAAQQDVEDRARRGELDLLYIAPERLLQSDTLALFSRVRVCLVAIDEAHCVSAWGHDFRQDYLALNQLRSVFPDTPRLALTATADQRTQADIVDKLDLNAPQRFTHGFDRPNIYYSVQAKSNAKKQLLSFLRTHNGDSGIVYCLSRRSVESIASWLCQQGYVALPYHAGLDTAVRQDHQDRFLREDGVIVVATIAFGMGIDKPDVRFVAHLDLPKNMEAYYQETGRAGRDGLPADAWMLYGLQDVVRLSRMVDESSAAMAQKQIERSKLTRLLAWCEVTTCRRQALLAYFDDPTAAQTPCGHCDVCVHPPATWDATEPAQKALSCVYRTGQRFGAGHVIDVLRGQLNDKVEKFAHQALSTFGIGRDLSERQWRSVFRQLLARGFLQADHQRFGGLVLTPESKAILRGETKLMLRPDADKVDAEQVKATRTTRSDYVLPLEDEDLMQDLKALRGQLASAANVPPYVVFHDATLLGIVEHRPRNADELLEISGVGQAKLKKYGEDFLAVVRTHTMTTPAEQS
ncbi:MAG: DNA helicase RecQ [Pseudomonadota bacterium]